jgi:hypothetical protein
VPKGKGLGKRYKFSQEELEVVPKCEIKKFQKNDFSRTSIAKSEIK